MMNQSSSLIIVHHSSSSIIIISVVTKWLVFAHDVIAWDLIQHLQQGCATTPPCAHLKGTAQPRSPGIKPLQSLATEASDSQ
jgi:hypothetical protein